jgi:hypothetical protein
LVQTGSQAARQEHELRKRELAERVELFESRLREQLDWRSRLRRNRGKLIGVGAGAALLLTALILLRARLGERSRDVAPATLDDVARELHDIRKQLERRSGESPLWQRLVLRSAVAAASAGGAYAARRMVRGTAPGQPAGEASSAG